jgi:hypothetical protein
MTDISSGEILRFMERHDELVTKIIAEQKQVGETLSANTVILKNILEQTTGITIRVNKLEGFRFIAKGVFLAIGVMWTVFTFVVPYVKEYYSGKTVSDEEFNQLKSQYEKTASN